MARVGISSFDPCRECVDLGTVIVPVEALWDLGLVALSCRWDFDWLLILCVLDTVFNFEAALNLSVPFASGD